MGTLSINKRKYITKEFTAERCNENIIFLIVCCQGTLKIIQTQAHDSVYMHKWITAKAFSLCSEQTIFECNLKNPHINKNVLFFRFIKGLAEMQILACILKILSLGFSVRLCKTGAPADEHVCLVRSFFTNCSNLYHLIIVKY